MRDCPASAEVLPEAVLRHLLLVSANKIKIIKNSFKGCT